MALGVNIVSTFDAKGINRAVTQFKALEGVGNKATYALRTIDSAAKQLAAAAVKAAAGVAVLGGFAVREFAKFDGAMTESLAIMGDVSDAMREEMTKAARDMAKTTTFSATEAAKSYFYLASAGLNAEQSLKALPVVAKFAQAGMFDMALATDLLTDAQSALGLTIRNNTVKNMENMTRVSDVLVKANTLANATVQQFSESLTNKAGAAMKAVNMDIEEGVAVLAALADQGIKAEEAGTQFSIALRDLQTKALDNAASFEALNITVYDSDGNLRNMADIVADLENALSGASDETKKATLLQLGFADRSVATILALLGTSDAIKTYETQLRLAGGTTEDIAKKQLESLQSQLKLARNAIVDTAISVGQALAPKIEALTNFIRELNRIVGQEGLGAALRYTAGEIMNAIGNMGTLGNTIYVVTAAFVALRATAIAATISINLFNTALLNTPWGRAVALALTLITALAAAYIKFEGFRDVVNKVANAVIWALEKIVNSVIQFINSFITANNLISKALKFIGIDLGEVGEIGYVSFGRIGEAANDSVPAIYNVYNAIVDAESRLAGFGNKVGIAFDPQKVYTLADAQNAVKFAEQNLARLRKAEHKDLVALKSATDELAAANANLALITGDKKSGSVGKAVETTQEKLRKFTEALRSQTQAQRSLRDATKATADAQKNLQEANDALVKAQDQFNLVVNGYGKDSKQARTAQEDLDVAQRDVERSAYGIEEAIFAVQKAEEDLAKERQDPETNATKIREAEIALAQAKLSVKDATDRERDATRELARAQQALDEATNGAKEGSDAYKTVLDQLNAAKKAQEDAIDRVVQAQERERDAIYEVGEAQRELNSLEKEYGKLLAARAKLKYDAGQVVVPTVTTPTTIAPSGDGQVILPDVAQFVDSLYAGQITDTERANINVVVNAGMGTDGQAVALDIVNVLKQYERTNGYVPITSQYTAFL